MIGDEIEGLIRTRQPVPRDSDAHWVAREVLRRTVGVDVADVFDDEDYVVTINDSGAPTVAWTRTGLVKLQATLEMPAEVALFDQMIAAVDARSGPAGISPPGVAPR